MSFIKIVPDLKSLSNIQNATSTSLSDLAVVSYLASVLLNKIIAIIIIGRELLISAFRQVAASKNIVMAADMFGKIKTCTQDAALPLLFLVSFLTYDVTINATALQVIQIVGYCLIGLATLFTILSGANYMIKNKEVLKD